VRGLPRFDDPNLLVGAEGFSDAGVYRLRADLCIVQSVDYFPPLVDDPYQFGQIAAANSMSDLFAMGARPVTALNIVCFPDKELDLSVLRAILDGGAERVRAAGAVVLGGHSLRDQEIKYGLAVTGVAHPDQLLTSRHARPGDVLVLTKPLGTGFLTTANKAGRCDPSVFAAAVESMRALNRAAGEAAVELQASAATDVTGFGLAGHALELAEASGVTLELHVGQLPLLPGAVECLQQGFRTRASQSNREYVERELRVEGQPDPTRLEFLFDAQTSGGLLVCLSEERVEEFLRRVRPEAPDAAVIGCVRPREKAALVVTP